MQMRVLRCLKLHNEFIGEPWWGLMGEKFMKDFDLFTSEGQIYSLR